jgi:hypothetical protein
LISVKFPKTGVGMPGLTRALGKGVHGEDVDPRGKADALERSLDELHGMAPEPFREPNSAEASLYHAERGKANDASLETYETAD